jgi:lipoyl(octanoyl) transferase
VTVVDAIRVRELGAAPYEEVLREMKAFTRRRTDATPDEMWLVEHPAVYTLGQGAADAKVPNGIPVVRSDRGGEITYHGPGQVVLYALVDLARRGIRVKRFVWLLEQAAIDLLARSSIRGERRPGAPGVYVAGAKIAALGIRVSRGRSYHGLSLNVDMDLAPFLAIDPCGYAGLPVTQMRDLGVRMDRRAAGTRLAGMLTARIDNE